MERKVSVCGHYRPMAGAASCAAGGGRLLLAAMRAEVAARGLPWVVAETVCLGYCNQGPNLKARGGPLLHGCKAEDAAAIVDRLLADWVEADDAEAAAEPAWPAPGT